MYRSKLAVEISVKVSELGTFPAISAIPKTYLDLLYPSNKEKGGHFLFKDDADIDYLCVECSRLIKEDLKIILYPMDCLKEDMRLVRRILSDYEDELEDFIKENEYEFEPTYESPFDRDYVETLELAQKGIEYAQGALTMMESDLQVDFFKLYRIYDGEIADLLLGIDRFERISGKDKIRLGCDPNDTFIDYIRKRFGLKGVVELPVKVSNRDDFVRKLEESLVALMKRAVYFIRGIQIPLMATVLYTPPLILGKASKDLDNLMKIIVPPVNKILRPPLKEWFEVKKKDYGYLAGYEVIKVPRQKSTPQGGLLWLSFKKHGFHNGLVDRSQWLIWEWADKVDEVNEYWSN
ncbi:hypothetical protein ES703_30564 [subsurface metagenome]